MKKYTCSRISKNMGPIKVRVVCGMAEDKVEQEESENVTQQSTIMPAPKRKALSLMSKGDKVIVAAEIEKRLKLEKSLKDIIAERDQIIVINKERISCELEKRLQLEKTLKDQITSEVKKQAFDTEKWVQVEQLLRSEIAEKDQKICDLRKKVANVSSDSHNPLDSFRRGIEKLAATVLPKKHGKSKAQLLMEIVNEGRLFNGEISEGLKQQSMAYVRQLFRPWRLLKAGDTSPIGALKSSSIQALRDVIDEHQENLFPSVSAVSRTRKLLDAEAGRLIGYECRHTQHGEVFFLNFNKTLRLLLKACGLHDIAQTESVHIALAIDGADMIRDRTHVSAGVKITDSRGIHPITRQPLLQRSDDGEEKFVRVQSFELCSVMMIADARDSKSLYEDVFKEFYDWGNDISRFGLPEADGMPALRPFNVVHNSDMKAAWYLSGRGGGCKSTNFFCLLCSCSKDQLVSFKVGDQRCDRCQRRNKPKCYHHPVCDSVQVAALLSELESELGEYYTRHKAQYEEVQRKSRIVTDHMVANKESQINHIDFVIPPQDTEQTRQYTQFISRECYIRGIPLVGSQLEDWRAVLRCSLAMENKIKFLLQVREWHNNGRTVVPLVEVIEIIIPCILHLENRSSEKIITTILRYCFCEFAAKNATEASHKLFLNRIQGVFQKEILGTVHSPSQWKLPWSKGTDGIVIDHVQVRNQTGRKIMARIDRLIEAALQDGPTRAKLLVALQFFCSAMQILVQHRKLTEDEIEIFQANMDDFHEIWVELFARDGMSNYIHHLGSGHIHYFLEKYECLYLYSQQGWEALNNTIQAYIHQNSQRGGKGSGQRAGEKSFIYPLVRYLLRDLLWKTGDADQFFINLEGKNST
jgi:hypothetical protein